MSYESQISIGTKFIFGLVVPIGVVLLGFSAISALGTSKPKKTAVDSSDPTVQLTRFSVVSVAPVLPFHDSLSLDIDVSGYVVPFRQITVAAEVAGRIKSKSTNCQLGRFVKAGDPLFEIDPTDYQSEVDRLTAMRESEYAQQTELDQDVANAQRALKLAEEEVDLQEKELARIQNLPKGFASETELDQARGARLSSRNQRLTIQNQLESLSTKRARILLAERLAGTQLSQAKINLARTAIKAPISGVIVSESVETDSYIQKGATLCVIDDTQRVEVSCNLRPDQLTFILDQEGIPNSDPDSNSGSYLLPQTPVTVTYQVAGREEIRFEWEGHLSRYEGIGLDPQSRTIPVRVTVNNPRQFKRSDNINQGESKGAPPALVRGMFVNCTIRTNPKRNLVLIPKLALQPGNQVWFFEEDPSLIEANPNANRATGEKSQNVDEAKPAIQLEDWIAGRLRILKDVKAIRTTRNSTDDGKEYWIVESRSGLTEDGLVITSPLSSIKGDGTDKVRRQKMEGAKQ